ncbi:cytochrome c1 [Thiohalomonas denitrificans]|uniref:cytochrome c1 n=1 Tax=Thiohalomonas denitrificans TaxID=415747 RepID=UPI0026F0512F|nr:cytochrome c1 [Thiohalomonas denitrificans]
MKKFIYALLIAALPGLTIAAGGVQLDKAPVDLHDKASLQRGAQLFANYCLSCHSAQYMRFNRMARDLEMSDEQVRENLMFTTDKVGETMNVAMPEDQAETWFGTAPPDLSVLARARGADYLYTYFRSFYVDDSRPFGVNNAVFPDVGMPHALWELEGLKKPVLETVVHGDQETQVITGYQQVTEGSMTEAEYDRAAADLTNFMVYIAEPIRTERERLGWWVLGFLGVFFVFAYLLKKEYWRDIH